MTKIKKAIFPVGGLGTRFLPATKALPKEMLPIFNKPLIQRAFEEAKAAGIEQFIFITGRNKNVLSNHFDCVYELEKELSNKEKHESLALTRDWVPQPGNISFIRQQHPLGLGHAVWCARNFINNEPVAVLLADELFISSKSNSVLGEMIDVYNKNPGNIVAVANVAPEFTNRYGIVAVSDDSGTTMKINGMVEKPNPQDAPSNISIVGRYIIEPGIFDILQNQERGSGGEIQLTDAINKMIPSTSTTGYRFDGLRIDCGNPLGFLQANIEFAIRDEQYGNMAKDMVRLVANKL